VQGRVAGGNYNANTDYTYFQADHSSGGYISLAFDRSNRPAISHYDSERGDLRFAKAILNTRTGLMRFGAQTVASRGTVGAYSALYYDAAGVATILFRDKSHDQLVQARFRDTWTITPLADGGREAHVARYGKQVAFTNVDDTSAYVMFEE